MVHDARKPEPLNHESCTSPYTIARQFRTQLPRRGEGLAFAFAVSVLGFQFFGLGLAFTVLGFGVCDFGFGVRDLRFRFWGWGFAVSVLGVGV
jgi:hypothetical protein